MNGIYFSIVYYFMRDKKFVTFISNLVFQDIYNF